MIRRLIPLLALAAGCSEPAPGDPPPRPPLAFLEKHRLGCHDTAPAKGGLDLSTLPMDPTDAKTFAAWVKVHDRARDGEMPPSKQTPPAPAELAAFLNAVSGPLLAADRRREE